MKASTIFVLCIALFIGLAAMAGAKYVGLFDRKGPIDTTTKEEPLMILVANNDLYPDIAITPADVRVREVTAADKEKAGNFFEKNKGDLLPPNVAAANLRVPIRKIRADEALRRDMFKEELADAVSLRLDKGMEAVNVAVPRERSAGGQIQLGEYVNVNLTSRITEGDGKQTIRTAQIARDCRVIMKRNNLYQQMRSDPEGPIPFTLEANPYRAALIDYAQHKGELSLTPVYKDINQITIRQARRNEGMGNGMPKSFSDMNSIEYRDEDTRIEKLRRGDLQLGDADMVRIFNIQPAPVLNAFYVRQVRGVNPVGTQTIPVDTMRTGTPTGTNGKGNGSGNGSGPVFSSLYDDKDCPTCPKKKDPGIKDSMPSGKDK